MTTPLRLAHRGDLRVAPENSLEALLAATRIPGCDGVEFDVRLSRDGVPVLLHDHTLARVHGVHTPISQLAAAEAAHHAIPTLEEVLVALPPSCWLDVELKGEDHGQATADVLLAARGPAPTAAVISSFEASALVAIADLLPGWGRWLNAQDLSTATLSSAVGLGCRGVSVSWGVITPERMRAATDAGLDVAAWTVRRLDTFERLGRLGVVACCVEAAALDG